MFPRRVSLAVMTPDATSPAGAIDLRRAAAGAGRACALGILLAAAPIPPAAGQDGGVFVNYDLLNSLGDLPPVETETAPGPDRPGGRAPAADEPLRSRLLVRPQRSAAPKAAAGPPPTPRRRPALSRAPAGVADSASLASPASPDRPVASDQGPAPSGAPPARPAPVQQEAPAAPPPRETPTALPVPPHPPPPPEETPSALPVPPPPPAAPELVDLPDVPAPAAGSAVPTDLPPVPEAPELAALAPETPPAPAAPATAGRAQESKAPPSAAGVEAPAANLLRIIFASEDLALGSDDEAALDELAVRLRAEPERRVELRAHAAGSGGLARRTSLSRARAIRSFLVDKGVASTRIDIRPFGAESRGGPPDRVDIVDARR